MLNATITVDNAIEYLNSTCESDPLAIRALLCLRIPCNQALADHPTAQVNDNWPEGDTISIIDLLNGLFDVDNRGWGAISYLISDDENIRFVRTPEELEEPDA